MPLSCVNFTERLNLIAKLMSGKYLCFYNYIRIIVFCFRLQVQLDEVVDVMQDNINKTLNRGTRLDDLQDKSGKMLLL